MGITGTQTIPVTIPEVFPGIRGSHIPENNPPKYLGNKSEIPQSNFTTPNLITEALGLWSFRLYES